MSSADQYSEVREAVCRYARRMHDEGLVVGTAGNVSARVPGEDVVAITPSSLPYPEMTPEDVQLLRLDGTQMTENRPPSFERAVHLAIYRARSDVGAIFHTHAQYSSVLAVLRQPLPPILEELVPYVGGAVEAADYQPSATEELGEAVLRALGERNAVILANHGNVCCGTNLERAYRVCLLVERTAKVYVLARLLGEPHALPPEVVESEREMFKVLQSFR